jgi:hypothetical protein
MAESIPLLTDGDRVKISTDNDDGHNAMESK